MGQYSLAVEVGGKHAANRASAFAAFNRYLEQRPQVVGAVLRATMNGNTPDILYEALGNRQVEVDQADLAKVRHLADWVLDASSDGRTLGFSGGDTVHGVIWDSTTEIRGRVRAGEAPMRDLGYAMLAASVAFTLQERPLEA